MNVDLDDLSPLPLNERDVANSQIFGPLYNAEAENRQLRGPAAIVAIMDIMRHVPGANLWIDSVTSWGQGIAIQEAKIKAFVTLAQEDRPFQPGREAIVHRFPLVDGAGNPPELIRSAIETVAELVREEVPTLIRCSSSMSRSAAVAAAALAQAKNLDASQTVARLCAACNVDVSLPLWLEIHSAVVAAGDPILGSPPKIGRREAMKERPADEKPDWPM